MRSPNPSPPDISPGDEVDTIVIGTGLAGAASAWHLRRAGHRVLVLDARQESTRASGIGGGMANPMMARKGRPVWMARESLDELERMGVETGPAPQLAGLGAALLRPAKDEEQAGAFREQAAEHPDLGRYLEPEDCTELSHIATMRHGVLCVRRGASLDLGQTAKDWLEDTQRRIVGPDWSANEHPDGITINTSAGPFHATRALLCLGHGMLSHPLTRTLKLHGIKGQIIRVRKPDGLPNVLPPISSGAYIVDTGDGTLWVGSTFERNWVDEGPTHGATQDLLERGASVIPSLAGAEVLESRTGFRVTVPGTRLPMCGPLRPGSRMYVLTGLGARGLLHSAWFAARIPVFFNNPEAIPTRCRVVHRSAES